MQASSRAVLAVAALAGVLMPGAALSIDTAQPVLVTSPTPVPARHDRPRVFLGGSIDMGSAPDWQADMIKALAAQRVVILNPRRADWNKAWRPDADDPHFREQVQWELGALDSADIIVLYLSPGSQSPVSLLEMGLHARSGKLIVYCPNGYWRKGNVDITAAKYDVEQVSSIDSLVAATKARITRWRPGKLGR